MAKVGLKVIQFSFPNGVLQLFLEHVEHTCYLVTNIAMMIGV